MSVLSWLRSVDPQVIYDKKTPSKTARVALPVESGASGRWFRDDPKYQGWKHSAQSDLLWVTGKPGCGKSVLAEMIWGQLRSMKSSEVVVARFYCDSEDVQASDYSCLLRTLLKQISNQQVGLNHELEMLYNENSGKTVSDSSV